MNLPIPHTSIDLRNPSDLLLWLAERNGADILEANQRRTGLSRLMGDLLNPGPLDSPLFPGADDE